MASATVPGFRVGTETFVSSSPSSTAVVYTPRKRASAPTNALAGLVPRIVNDASSATSSGEK